MVTFFVSTWHVPSVAGKAPNNEVKAICFRSSTHQRLLLQQAHTVLSRALYWAHHLANGLLSLAGEQKCMQPAIEPLGGHRKRGQACPKDVAAASRMTTLLAAALSSCKMFRAINMQAG